MGIFQLTICCPPKKEPFVKIFLAYVPDDFERKKICKKYIFKQVMKVFEFFFSFFFSFNFYFYGGLCPLTPSSHPSPGLHPWTPHHFGLRTLDNGKLTSTAYLAINPGRFFEKISQHLKKKCSLRKKISAETYAKKNLTKRPFLRGLQIVN